ncbi:hypothetical protein [Hydrogenimonas urashimensis]|uniref:hypothetical protein n=1 Tax=Hydrogenimonas urashimensis TaxID=2740515 RepID=UPI001916911B|nr:hypothetical protein [Hydrogenimonas urashimensis]
MIYGMTPVKAAQAVLGKMAAIEVNALLQLGIRVLEKQASGRYLVEMGRHTFTTKSDTPLEPGLEYWVEMADSREGIVHLKRLHPKPLLLKKGFMESFTLETLQQISKKSDPSGTIRDHLLQTLSSAQSKEQFQNITQLLLSFHQGVLTLPIEDKGRKMLLQMRRRGKNKDLNQKSVEFYAAMSNLGPIEGVIDRTDHLTTLRLNLYYPKSVALLEREKTHLEGFDRIEIRCKEEQIHPLWDGKQPGLLDIKG